MKYFEESRENFNFLNKKIYKIVFVRVNPTSREEGTKSLLVGLSDINPNGAGEHNVPALFSGGYFSMKKGV